jgi:hypothetical protein
MQTLTGMPGAEAPPKLPGATPDGLTRAQKPPRLAAQRCGPTEHRQLFVLDRRQDASPAARPGDYRQTTERGQSYRLMMTNGSGDNHPVHPHRHTFEVTKIGDKATAGVM